VVGLEFERAAKAGDRFVQPACCSIDFAEVGISGGIIRVRRDGLANPVYRELMAAHLLGDDAPQAERLGIVWLHREDLAVNPFGLCQTSGLMMLNRDLERLWDRHGGRMENGNSAGHLIFAET